MARRHFDCRVDVTQNVYDGFIHRETQRLMGVEVTTYKQQKGARSLASTETLEEFLTRLESSR